ncbi:MAG: hypothetical protein M1827_002207 [Pycnora praestabilis]|nr:MAG: hypothetical protein M1827_002207 [Pycnora praestabilis]
MKAFSTLPPHNARNRIFETVRNEEELSSLLLLSATNQTSLITLWTATWCPSCRIVLPILKGLVEDDGVGEQQGGIGFAEVELDAMTIGDLPMRYMINSVPTLLAFSRQEAQLETRLTSVDEIKDPEFLKQWIEREAGRGGAGGAGGSSLFSGLFGINNR